MAWINPEDAGKVKHHQPSVRKSSLFKPVQYFQPNNALLVRNGRTPRAGLDGLLYGTLLLGGALTAYNPTRRFLAEYDSEKAKEEYLNQLDDYWYY